MDFGIERIDLTKIQFTPELVRCVPSEVAQRFELLPIFRYGDCLTVAFGGQPPDVNVIDQVFGELCGQDSGLKQLEVVTADSWQLGFFLHKIYGMADDQSE